MEVQSEVVGDPIVENVFGDLDEDEGVPDEPEPEEAT
jgi:hypothetical protein